MDRLDTSTEVCHAPFRQSHLIKNGFWLLDATNTSFSALPTMDNRDLRTIPRLFCELAIRFI